MYFSTASQALAAMEDRLPGGWSFSDAKLFRAERPDRAGAYLLGPDGGTYQCTIEYAYHAGCQHEWVLRVARVSLAGLVPSVQGEICRRLDATVLADDLLTSLAQVLQQHRAGT